MNIIVAGPSRSGKTTVAKQVSNLLGMNFFPFDSIISTLEDLYPQIEIKHQDDNFVFSPKLAKFVARFFEHLAYEDMESVIDLYQLFPNDFVNHFSNSEVKIVYLGYPNLTAEEKLNQIRDYERPQDWTRKTPDSEMLAIINCYLKESKIMYQQCQETGLPFFDTGKDFSAGVDSAVNHLISTSD